jgi:hypothetical protein
MRGRIQFHSSISYIFAGSVQNRMNEVFSDPSSPFYKSAASLEVGSIDASRFVPFLRRKFKSGKRIAQIEILERIIGIAGNIPGDVQELCACIYDTTSSEETLTEEHLEAGLRMIFAREKKAYETALTSVTGLQLRCLVALADGNPVKVLSSDFLEKSGIRTSSSVQAALKRLVKLKIIYRYMGAYKLANPYFGLWLLRNGY